MKIVKLLFCAAALFQTAVHLNAQNYKLVWSDEFNTTALDTKTWNYETGTGTDGWGNWEKQYYTDRTDNVSVADGKLIITCKKESYGGADYTSGRIQTRDKVMFKYGKIESLIKVPMGAAGVWPAFWMLGTGHGGAWPYCGEIDIMEMMCKSDQTTWNQALTTYHWNTQGVNGDYQHGSHGLSVSFDEQLGSAWRIYGLEWNPSSMTGYVCDKDGSNRKDICTLDISSHEGGMEAFSDYEFYIVYNFAFGGTYVNGEIDNAWTGDNMQVDWVRVYQDMDNEPSSTNTIGDYSPVLNHDYIKVMTDRKLEGSILDVSASPFYIWSNTMKAIEATPYEGDGVISLENCGSTWYGAGYVYEKSVDYTNIKDYTLHFMLKTNSVEPFELKCNGVPYVVTSDKLTANEWVEFNIPVKDFNVTMGKESSFQPFSFNQAAGASTMSGRTFVWDDIYYYLPGGTKKAVITVGEQSAKLKDKNATTKVAITGSNLTEDVVVALSNTTDFVVSPSVIKPVDGKVNTEVEVKFVGDRTSATKVSVTSGELKAFTNVSSTISNVERLTTDYILLCRETSVDGSFRDWSMATLNSWGNEWTNGPTLVAADGVEPFEGEGCIAFKNRCSDWYGAGYVVNEKLDYENINRYTLHFACYASNTQPITIKICGAPVAITPKKANTWEEFEISLGKLGLYLDVKSSIEPFAFNQGDGEAVELNKIIAFDDIYLYIPGGSGVAALSCTPSVTVDTRYGTTGTFRLSGSNLGDGAKVSLACTNSKFELSSTSITAANGKVNQEVTVTYTGDGIEYGTVVVKCGSIVKEMPVSSFSGEAYSSACNLIEAMTDGGRYYAHTWDWVGLTGSTTTIDGHKATFYMPLATTTQHQAQFWIDPSTILSLTAGTEYSVKATLISDKDVTLTFKVTEHGDNKTALVEKVVSMRAGVATAINWKGVALEGMNNESVYFDFGGNGAETTVTLLNLEVGLAECYGEKIPEGSATAIAHVGQSGAKVYASRRVIFIENAEGDAQIFDMMGNCVYSGCERQVSLNNTGVYFVKVDGKSQKVAVY